MIGGRYQQWLPVVFMLLVFPVRAADHKHLLAQLKSLPVQQGISSLQRHLKDNPDWQRGRLELARLLYDEGLYAAARGEVKQAVASGLLPEKVEPRVLAFYKQILEAERAYQQQEKVQRIGAPDWSVQQQLTFAVGQQDRWQSDLFDGSRAEPSTRGDLLQAENYVESQWLGRAERGILWLPEARWQWLAGWSGRQYSDNDVSSPRQVLLMTSLKRKWNPDWDSSAFLRGQYRFDIDAAMLGAGVQLQWHTRQQRLGIQAQIDHRDRTETGLDSDRLGLSFLYQYRPVPDWQLSSRIDWQDFRYDDNRYDYDRRGWGLSTRYLGQPDWYGQLGVRQRHYHYQTALAATTDSRVTDIEGLHIALGYQLAPGWLLKASVERQHERRPVDQSTQNLYEISLTVNF